MTLTSGLKTSFTSLIYEHDRGVSGTESYHGYVKKRTGEKSRESERGDLDEESGKERRGKKVNRISHAMSKWAFSLSSSRSRVCMSTKKNAKEKRRSLRIRKLETICGLIRTLETFTLRRERTTFPLSFFPAEEGGSKTEDCLGECMQCKTRDRDKERMKSKTGAAIGRGLQKSQGGDRCIA